MEMIFGDKNEVNIHELQEMIDRIRRESQLIIVFNLAKINENVSQLYDILLLRPDRLSNAEILSTLSQNQNQIDQRILTDRLLSMKLPIGIVIWTGYSGLLGCSLSDEYYQLAISMDLKPNDIYRLSLIASFYTEKTPRDNCRELFPFARFYDTFAKRYTLENSTDWKLQILRNCQFFLSRPLASRSKRRRRRRRIIDCLYF
ncbi:hypothetical protein LOAG_06845 [Loa loa]|nr:hypothetical protein LOAG_06845 [Loa loa]EFO21639.1 hypothetical protein LOAG_06845 [Loa loa]